MSVKNKSINMNKTDIKNIDYSDHLNYTQYIYFKSNWCCWRLFAEIVDKKSAVAAIKMTECLCWCCMNKTNKINIADKSDTDNCKHYSADK